MTDKARNSIDLYRGNNPSTIETALRMQHRRVVEELKEHFCASDIKELAVKLSIGEM